MPADASSQTQHKQAHAGRLTDIGGWLFRRRTVIPLPLALAVLLTPAHPLFPDMLAPGIALVACGEAIRLWGVHQIGAISRTRTDRLGPLIASGPFAFVRNPLYLGNALLWIGFALSARLLWLAPVFVLLLGFEYHAIVRWEEQLLEERLGERYREYARHVPRWLPRLTPYRSGSPASTSDASHGSFSWKNTFFSERGTLIAIVAGYILLALKARA